MSKRQFLSIVGLWIIIYLFLGIPAVWDKILSIISGIIIIIIAYRLPHESRKVQNNLAENTFTENK